MDRRLAPCPTKDSATTYIGRKAQFSLFPRPARYLCNPSTQTASAHPLAGAHATSSSATLINNLHTRHKPMFQIEVSERLERL